MKPYLALFRAGPNSLHRSAIERLDEQNFDYALSWFGSTPPRDADGAVFVDLLKGPKWDGLAQTLRNHWDTIQQYRYVWLPDDDLLCVPDHVSRMFAICDELQLELAQPALTPDSYGCHLITFQHSEFQLRFTNFVEIMAPVMSVDMLARVFPMMEGQISGFGLDTLWPRLTCTGRMAIIDDTPIKHTRPVGGPNHAYSRENGGLSPGEEALLISTTHGVETPPDFQINYAGLLQNGDPICLGHTNDEANTLLGAVMRSMQGLQASPVLQARYLSNHHQYWSRSEHYPRGLVRVVLNRALKHAGIRFPAPLDKAPLVRHPATQLGAALDART